MTNKESRQAQAVKLMQQLGLKEEYIDTFVEEDRAICMRPSDSIFYFKVCDKLVELERELDVTIYAALFDRFSFGNCATFLCVPKFEEDWDKLVIATSEKDIFQVYAYVYNFTEESHSEYGYVQLKIGDGAIKKRVC